MPQQSSLSDAQRQAAVALFDAGFAPEVVAARIGGSADAVRRLSDRWRLRGAEALVPVATQQRYSYELKREIVQRFLSGEAKLALAQEYGLPSPKTIEPWLRRYRAEGEDGLRPNPIGRPRRPPPPVGDESELDRLRRENEWLRAEVAYLGKLQALGAAERGIK